MANTNTPFQLNGYSYADCKATFNGIELPGVTSFEFNADQSKENNYGFGKNPISRSRMHVEYSGNMEMDYDTQNLLSGLSATGLLRDVPPGILIFSLEREDGGKEIITMTGFEFNMDGLGGSQGDANLTKSIDVIYGSYSKESF